MRCLFFPSLESKSARKNKKRREKKAAGGTAEGFKLEEDVPGVGTTPLSNSVTRTEIVRPPSPVDPIADIKRQIEEAKAAKVFSTACCIDKSGQVQVGITDKVIA